MYTKIQNLVKYTVNNPKSKNKTPLKVQTQSKTVPHTQAAVHPKPQLFSSQQPHRHHKQLIQFA